MFAKENGFTRNCENTRVYWNERGERGGEGNTTDLLLKRTNERKVIRTIDPPRFRFPPFRDMRVLV